MQMTTLFEVPALRWREFLLVCCDLQGTSAETRRTPEEISELVQDELSKLRYEGFAVPHASALIYQFATGSFGTLLWHDGPRDESYEGNKCDLYIGTSYAIDFDPPIPCDWYACRKNRTIYGVSLGHKRLKLGN